MRWSEELTLISTTPPAEPVNENGFKNPPAETSVVVYANKKSVGYAEFYKAASEGYNTELKFDVHTEEYSGQKIAEYNGVRYRVLRTWVDPKTGDTTELTLSDLKEQGSEG